MDETLKQKWIEAIAHENDWTPMQYAKVCSKHFDSSDFNSADQKIRTLKSNAVPSLFLPQFHHKPEYPPISTIAELQPKTEPNISLIKDEPIEHSIDFLTISSTEVQKTLPPSAPMTPDLTPTPEPPFQKTVQKCSDCASNRIRTALLAKKTTHLEAIITKSRRKVKALQERVRRLNNKKDRDNQIEKKYNYNTKIYYNDKLVESHKKTKEGIFWVVSRGAPYKYL